MYAVLDTEATGGKKGEEDMIEIAIYRYDGKEVTDQMMSLVQPERKIDPYVQKLTHITPKLVKTAPKFHELAKRIVEITQDAILVGHNIEFDYRLLRQEFRKLGYEYERQVIDTVPLSKKYFPEAASHSLGKLSVELGIPVTDRHRASGDARATLELFKLLLQKDSSKIISKKKEDDPKSAGNIYESFYSNLPNTEGIIYFYDKDKNVAFLTQTDNISLRVKRLLISRTKLSAKIRKIFHSVEYEETGTPFISLIKETDELLKLKPIIKGRKRRIEKKFKVCLNSENGYKTLVVSDLDEVCKKQILKIKDRAEGEKIILKLTRGYNLCPKLNAMSQTDGACFSYDLGECEGACIGEEKPKSYNKRTNEILEKINLKNKSFLIIDKGRKMGEKSFVWVKDGACLGYGYYELYHQIDSIKRIRERMTSVEPNKKLSEEIKSILIKNKYKEILELND